MEYPVHDVEETSTVTLTIEKPADISEKDLVLLKDGEELKPSNHIKITSTSPTTSVIKIDKVKFEDAGDYTVIVKGNEQPIVRLKVHSKPPVRQEMQLPKTQFKEHETLTIICEIDDTTKEPFTFLHNEQPIIPDNRVTTTIEENKYTIVVKALRPNEDEGVYTLKSEHLIIFTPSITIVPVPKKPEQQTTTTTTEITKVIEEKKVGFLCVMPIEKWQNVLLVI